MGVPEITLLFTGGSFFTMLLWTFRAGRSAEQLEVLKKNVHLNNNAMTEMLGSINDHGVRIAVIETKIEPSTNPHRHGN